MKTASKNKPAGTVYYLHENLQATIPALKANPHLNLVTFNNGQDLYQYLKSGHPAEALILDINCDAFEFIQLWNQDPIKQKIPIILIAPKVNSLLAQKAKILGIADIFSPGGLNYNFLLRLNYLLKKYYLLNKRPDLTQIKAVQSMVPETPFSFIETLAQILAPVKLSLEKLASKVFAPRQVPGIGTTEFEAYQLIKISNTTHFSSWTDSRIAIEKMNGPALPKLPGIRKFAQPNFPTTAMMVNQLSPVPNHNS